MMGMEEKSAYQDYEEYRQEVSRLSLFKDIPYTLDVLTSLTYNRKNGTVAVTIEPFY